ncbi:hypothetical protein GCM10007989_02910 [Devosia pacifica]|uniref:YdhG-like domain-containing protein n=1 Tax=Devosia pacifica TaxID=1335967 RepID=A0A918VPE1_9HYPH|nr:DUF1801 domain-containing protein [Devosia pacifica]GHA11962.1 hypothetical protein GCM10007989_02910 [Devosia pacifica]
MGRSTSTVTEPADLDTEAFLSAIEHRGRRADAAVLLEMMQRLTGYPPRLWRPGMAGFGTYHYHYESGHSGTSFRVGFAPRKANTVVYIMIGFMQQQDLLDRLGPHTTGKSCLYLKSLEAVDLDILEQLISRSLIEMERRYPTIPAD